MREPLVSVIMPTYNHGPYIAQAIEGVLNQNVSFPIELVIGEDCSTDGTQEIVFDYQKKHPSIIRVITSDENVGIKKNFYRTLKACRGKYLAFCEGDDYWHTPDKLQRQVKYLESNPGCGIIFGDCDVYYEKTRQLIKSININNGFRSPINLNVEELMWGRLIKWTCTAVAQKHLCEKIIESDPYLHMSDNFLLGDNQLWVELALITKVIYIPDCIATYRVLENSASNSENPRKLLLFWISVSEMKLYLCNKHKLSDIYRKKAESIWFEKSLYLAFLDRNAKLAMEVKRRKETFTWKEWLRYFGAKNILIHYGYRAALLCKKYLIKPNDSLFGN